jgi:hypothetical protein
VTFLKVNPSVGAAILLRKIALQVSGYINDFEIKVSLQSYGKTVSLLTLAEVAVLVLMPSLFLWRISPNKKITT